MSLLFTIVSLNVANMEVVPEKFGFGHGHCDQISSVDCDSGSLPGRRFSLSFLIPPLYTYVPKSKGLKRSRFTRIVGTDQHDGAPEFNLNIREYFEFSYLKFR